MPIISSKWQGWCRELSTMGSYEWSLKILESFKAKGTTEATDRLRSPSALDVEDEEDLALLLDPNYHDLEHGYMRNEEDGKWYISCRTDLGKECTGEMFDFWLSQCDNTERYKWWHPVDHKRGTWSEDYFKTPREFRQGAHYVGHRHKVLEDIAGVGQSLQIEFMSPSSFGFGDDFQSKFNKANVTACACGRVYAYDFPFGYLRAGYLLHMVCRQEDGSNILRSRFWLGWVDAGTGLGSSVINTIGNTKWFRTLKLPEKMAKGLHVHCGEEMFVLSQFLPQFYTEEKERLAALREESSNNQV